LSTAFSRRTDASLRLFNSQSTSDVRFPRMRVVVPGAPVPGELAQ
jgi:hypothetical protein